MSISRRAPDRRASPIFSHKHIVELAERLDRYQRTALCERLPMRLPIVGVLARLYPRHRREYSYQAPPSLIVQLVACPVSDIDDRLSCHALEQCAQCRLPHALLLGVVFCCGYNPCDRPAVGSHDIASAFAHAAQQAGKAAIGFGGRNSLFDCHRHTKVANFTTLTKNPGQCNHRDGDGVPTIVTTTVRIYATGLVNGIEITVIYTDHDPDERHIISAWRSEPHERRYFWNHLED